jgi:hypothetical protein
VGRAVQRNETDFEASFALSRKATQLHTQHPNVKWPSDCMGKYGSQVASGVHYSSDNYIERLQASGCISKTKMAVDLCCNSEPDAKHRLISRSERLQASRAAIEVIRSYYGYVDNV